MAVHLAVADDVFDGVLFCAVFFPISCLVLNNILFIIRHIHVYIQTIQLTIGSDGKHSAYMKVIS